MAWQHVHLVRELDLPHIEKLVLFALASRVDDNGECWPSVATLRRDTGLAHRTVQYRLRSLVARGLVSCKERRGATTVLRLHLCEPCMSVPQSGVQDAQDEARDMHPPVHGAAAEGAPDAPEVTKELPLNLHEPPGAGLYTTPASQNHANSETTQVGSGATDAWWTSRGGIDAKGRELQVPPRPGEAYVEYKARLFAEEAQRNRSG